MKSPLTIPNETFKEYWPGRKATIILFNKWIEYQFFKWQLDPMENCLQQEEGWKFETLRRRISLDNAKNLEEQRGLKLEALSRFNQWRYQRWLTKKSALTLEVRDRYVEVLRFMGLEDSHLVDTTATHARCGKSVVISGILTSTIGDAVQKATEQYCVDAGEPPLLDESDAEDVDFIDLEPLTENKDSKPDHSPCSPASRVTDTDEESESPALKFRRRFSNCV